MSTWARTYLATLALLLLCFAAPAEAQNVSATIHIAPDHVLPGLPVAFTAAITNASAADVRLDRSVVLKVSPGTGPAFDSQRQGEFDTDSAMTSIVLPAGKTTEFVWQTSLPLGKPLFFDDERLSRPGTYGLRLQFARILPDSDVFEPVLSNEVVLTVDPPQGEDLAVWSRLQEVAAPRSWSVGSWQNRDNLAAELLKTHPQSRYVQDLAWWAPLRDAEKIQAIEDAIAVDPNTMQADLLRLALGGVHYDRYHEALARYDVDDAVAEHEEALRITRAVTNGTRFWFVKLRASEALRYGEADADARSIIETQAKSLVPPSAPIVPGVDCIEKGIAGGGFVARFNYTLDGTGGKVIPPGPGNRMSPGAPDQGQTRVFNHGRHSFAASAVSRNGEPVEWQVDGRTATARADFGTTCAPETAQSILPIVECVRHDNNAAVVSFGYDNPNRFTVAIPIGSRNAFSTGADAGQPEIFLPGRQHDVFQVKVKDAPVTWTLNGASVTANPRQPRVCAAP